MCVRGLHFSTRTLSHSSINHVQECHRWNFMLKSSKYVKLKPSLQMAGMHFHMVVYKSLFPLYVISKQFTIEWCNYYRLKSEFLCSKERKKYLLSPSIVRYLTYQLLVFSPGCLVFLYMKKSRC